VEALFEDKDVKIKGMSFRSFRDYVRKYNLDVIMHTDHHWQVIGGKYLVNFYPSKKTIYVNGMTEGQRGSDVRHVVNAALGKNVPLTQEKHKRKKMTGVKAKLFRNERHCAICGEPLTFETASVDHKIPLSKGGSNFRDNLQLVHIDCNFKKANKLAGEE